MVKVTAYSKTGTKHEATVSLSAGIFDVEPNHELLGQAYRTHLANGRNAGATTLTRGLVAGGGKKPWRQKGTGRARVGSSRVPNWRGGGVVFGPTGTENHTLDLPVKMKRAAIRQALSLQAKDKKVVIIDQFDGSEGKVKSSVELFDKLGAQGTVLLVVADKTDLINRATRNISGVMVVSAKYLNVFTVMNADTIILTKDALAVVETWLGEKK